jgi:hypothetical protein
VREAIALAFAGAALSCGAAVAQDSGSINEANNPLTPKITINFQDYYVPSIYGLPDTYSNQFLFRGLIPWKLGESGQLFRFTTGLGDTTLMNFTTFRGPGHTEIALGPILVLPTGSSRTGSGAPGSSALPEQSLRRNPGAYSAGSRPISTRSTTRIAACR